MIYLESHVFFASLALTRASESDSVASRRKTWRLALFPFALLPLMASLNATAQPPSIPAPKPPDAVLPTTVDLATCSGDLLPAGCGGNISGTSDLGALVNFASAYLTSQSVSQNDQQTGGGHVSIPAGTYLIATEIVPQSNISYDCVTGATLTAGPSFLGRIFHGKGTQSNPLTNVTIDNCAISNGATLNENSSPPIKISHYPLDGIRLEWCNQCLIAGNVIGPIQGHYAIATVNSNDITVQSNQISNFGYGGVMNLVNNCISGDYATGTCETQEGTSTPDFTSSNFLAGGMSSSYGNLVNNCLNFSNGSNGVELCYGIGLAGSEDGQPPQVTNAQALYNTVSNISFWECFDSHGGANQSFSYNTCTNSYFGIQAGTVAGGSLTHLTVSGNNLIQGGVTGGAKTNGYCIVLAGANIGSLVSGATVDGNTCTGYGAGPSGAGPGVGAITLANTESVTASNNICNTYYQGCIDLYSINYNATITGNYMNDIEDAYEGSWISGNSVAAAGILISSPGSWGITVNGNVSTTLAPGNTPESLFYDDFEASQVQVDYGTGYQSNQINGPATETSACDNTSGTDYAACIEVTHVTGLYAGWYYPMSLSSLPIANDTNPNDVRYCYQNGTIGYNSSNQPAYVFAGTGTENGVGYFCEDSTDVIATGVANGTIITSLTGTGAIPGCSGAFWYYCLPPSMNIVVGGTNAQVLTNDGTSITLDQSITASNPVSITWQSGTVSLY